MALSSPQHSFIQFDPTGVDACCKGVNNVLLPVILQDDLSFQIISDATPPALEVIKIDGTVVSSNSGFVSAGSNVYSWAGNIDITGLACNECFQLQLGTAQSNVFIKKCDDCFTSILSYSNGTDYAGFLYCNTGFVNKVRVPLYLSKPKMPEVRSEYRKSQGDIKLVKSLLTKEYTVKTDFMLEQMHDAMAVALSHSLIGVVSSAYTGQISKSSEYNIEWDDDDLCVAPADFKVLATPFAVVNSNCVVCAAACVAVTVPSFSLPAATVGTAYNQTITLGGDPTFTLSNLVKPSWMSIGVSLNTVSFSGTPGSGDDGTGFNVSFDVLNACGTDSGAGTIDVTLSSCTPVGLAGSFMLPNATSYNAYSYNFALSGTAPFSLSSVTKPSWMTISISGSSVYFSGTPATSDEANGVSVSFNVDNCTSDTISLARTLNVVPGGARFGTTIFVSGDALNDNEIAPIIGLPGSTVTVKFTSYTNSNGGVVNVDGSSAYLNNTWAVVLDGSGNGSLSIDIAGVNNSGTIINAFFTIISVSSGAIGSPNVFHTSKAF